MSERHTAVVVGSGPNGLAAAITLAQTGCSVRVLEASSTIGGSARTAELTLPGFLHDTCSAVHPLAIASPFFKTLPLEKFGLKWIQPEIPLAHPLDDGTAACLHRDLEAAGRGLGHDGSAYRRLFSPLVRDWDKLTAEFLQPMLHIPRHPFALAVFGLGGLWPANFLANTLFDNEPAKALFAGIAAHSFLPLEAMASAAFGLILGAAGHAVGWPIPQQGSQSISNALADHFRALGGTIETEHPVRSLDDLPTAGITILDLTVWQFAQIAANRLPARYRNRLERFRHAPGVFKLDYALSGPIPWKAEACKRAGTLHVCGTMEEVATAEREITNGRIPERPFVLVAQQSVFDKTRAPGDQHTLWAYCHVPFGCGVDMSGRIESQIERFAPGFRDCILARHKSSAVDLEKSNLNLAGGDINGGAANLWQLIARPVLSPAPYRTPLPGVYLGSASTPPGGGVHGMCGYHAARTALRDFLGK